MTVEVGSFLTVSGKVISPLSDSDLDFDDLIHSISLICRYGGHVPEFYSVAQHSVLVYRHIKEEYPEDKNLIEKIQIIGLS